MGQLRSMMYQGPQIRNNSDSSPICPCFRVSASLSRSYMSINRPAVSSVDLDGCLKAQATIDQGAIPYHLWSLCRGRDLGSRSMPARPQRLQCQVAGRLLPPPLGLILQNIKLYTSQRSPKSGVLLAVITIYKDVVSSTGFSLF